MVYDAAVSSTSRSRRALQAIGPPGVAGLMIAILCGAFLTHSDFHNPLDEYTHFDFVVKIAQGDGIPVMGDTMGQEALQEWACSGEPSFQALTCGEALQNPELAPWSGVSPATYYSIPYYVVTAMITRGLWSLTELGWMDAARVASTAWLVGLVMLMVAVGRRIGGPTAAVVAGAVILGSMPGVLAQGASVNSDIPAVFMSFLTVWTWLLLREKSQLARWIPTLLVGVCALLVKQHSVVALVLVAGLELGLMYRHSRESGPSGPRWWGRAFSVIGGGVAASIVLYGLIYLVLEPALRGVGRPIVGMNEAIASAEPQDFGLASVKAYGFIGNVFMAPGYVPGVNGPWGQLAGGFGAMAVFGALLFAVLRSRRPWVESDSTIMRQITMFYVLAFPFSLLLYVKMQGLALFSHPRYYLIGMSFGVLLFFQGSGRKWAGISMVLASIFWAFILSEVLALPLA